ncbi:MAG: DEAD/DEAH box helicase family protein [Acetivibrionales bacterium]|jgi:superfamily II DNA or RNA helicase
MKNLVIKSKQKYRFKGEFRKYQKRVLENASTHFSDNRIHIVAAPGSGKTILGLELICRLGEPALVLSPTLSIRNQWKQRFAESFLDEQQDIDDIVSTSLKSIKFITSITYQTLHSAMNKLKSCNPTIAQKLDESEPVLDNSIEPDKSEQWDELCNSEDEDYDNFEIFKAIKDSGIKTICLDEAHHLRSEWQKALESFLKKLDKSYKIIALTATPPYDSNKYEWDKYISVCGEIDDEIFVPELVKEGNLCYHQDYIYFNYPSTLEMDTIKAFNEKIDDFLTELVNEGVLHRLATENLVFKNPDNYLDICFDDEDNFIGFLKLLESAGEYIPEYIGALFLSHKNKICMDTGFQFIFDHEELFDKELYDTVVSKLRTARLIERNKVRITSDRKVNNLMLQSVGKLESIREICNAEFEAMGSGLRMLILSDYIRKNYLTDIGTNNPFTQIGIVPIFETVRRALGNRAKLGVLTGSLIILPTATLPDIERLAVLRDFSFTCCHLVEGYVLVENSNSSNMVSLLTEAFQMGYIEILIGTKSLLGEGWDSPNINSLILASFVGSFVLSNQMRGRAIRIDPRNMYKSANIWHLITVEPPYVFKNKLMSIAGNDSNMIFNSDDYRTLARRFKTFVGPHYSIPSIENGIGRIDIIAPPFNKMNLERMNQTSLRMAVNREEMKAKWRMALGLDEYDECNFMSNYEMQKQVKIEKKIKPEILFTNYIFSIFATINFYLYLLVLRSMLQYQLTRNPSLAFTGFMAANVYMAILIKKEVFFARITSPRRRLKIQAEAVLETFKYMGEIKSDDVRVKVQGRGTDEYITLSLAGGTAYEKEIFASALSQMAAPIQRQKYLLIYNSKKKIKKYLLAIPCPELIARKREYVDFLQKEFKRKMLPYDVIYTRIPEGRDILLKARKLSLKSINTALTERIERYVFGD